MTEILRYQSGGFYACAALPQGTTAAAVLVIRVRIRHLALVPCDVCYDFYYGLLVSIRSTCSSW